MNDLQKAIEESFFDPEIIDFQFNGEIFRFRTDQTNHPNSKDGWIVGYDERIAVFGSHRENVKHTWSANGEKLAEYQAKELQEKIKFLKKEDDKKKREAIKRIKEVHKDSPTAPRESAYLTRKKINSYEQVKYITDRDMGFGFEISGLLIPIYDRKGMISAQIIPDEGKKLFVRNCRTKGGFFPFGSIENAKRIYVTEGFADAASIHEATGETAIAAFSAGNLHNVVAELRSSNLTAAVIIAADNDDAGRAAAKKCTGCAVIYPGNEKDFSDLYVKHGKEAIQEVLGQVEVEDESWRGELITKTKANGEITVLHRLKNIWLYLRHDKELKGDYRFNEFSQEILYSDQAEKDKPITDRKIIQIKRDIEDRIDEQVATKTVQEAIVLVAGENKFHPIREYLEDITWDGTPRIADFFTDFLYTPKDAYHMSVATSLFVKSVARIFQPGCKVDTMVILVGPQGIGKTSIWPVLYGKEYTVEITESLNNKDFFASLMGKWCGDFGELDQFTKADVSRVKQIITMTTDRYRPPYASTHIEVPRSCVFTGGTNNEHFLNDPTGGRRYLAIYIDHPVDMAGIEKSRDQLWAEGVALYKQGVKWWDIQDAEKYQEKAYIGDSWEELIPIWLDLRGDTPFTISDVLLEALKIERGQHTRSAQTRVGNALRRMGYKSKAKTLGDKTRIREYHKA